ncbi:MAG: DNA methyltransferase [Gammaproteobacteria bacterium]|nr:DNA methyltransferase [Gammaproteobacteria bacterium]
MHRLLKPTGSLFVHLDWRMTHYIKVELDKIFGVTNPAARYTNFVNEIVWCYKSGGIPRDRLSRKHDIILWYSKAVKKHAYHKQFMPYTEGTLQRGLTQYKKNLGDYSLSAQGANLTDWWTDIQPDLSPTSELRKRYPWPTRKPIQLLRRIIEMASNEGDLVADFFCGCGTTIDAAEGLYRKWIGIDASKTACEVMLDRMKEYHGVITSLNARPMTGKDFRDLPPFKFEKAAVRYIGGVTNHAQVGDGGIDGRLAFDGTPIQVKKEAKPLGDNDRFRGFYQHIKQHGRGIYITLNGYTMKAKERAAGWRREGLDVQLLTVDDLLNGNYREQPASVSG